MWPAPHWSAHVGTRRMQLIARKAFTLVELLVDIGIIGVLVSILMPVLSRVRESAGAVQCAANLRQFATARQLYANESKGVSCPGRLPKVKGSASVYALE